MFVYQIAKQTSKLLADSTSGLGLDSQTGTTFHWLPAVDKIAAAMCQLFTAMLC